MTYTYLGKYSLDAIDRGVEQDAPCSGTDL